MTILYYHLNDITVKLFICLTRNTFLGPQGPELSYAKISLTLSCGIYLLSY